MSKPIGTLGPGTKGKMKIVLQNRSNLSYVENFDGGWTKDGEGALEFPSSLDALLFCFDQDMVDMQMVARFADPALNFSMSVTDLRKQSLEAAEPVPPERING